MKKIILTLVLAGALLAGCNSNSKGKNPFDSISGQNQANEVIGFYNDALEFYKRNSSYTDDVVDYVDEAQEFLQKKASGGVAIKPIRPMKMITVSAKDNLKVPDGFGDKKEIIEKAFNGKVENNTVLLKGVVSRKKQVIPPLTKAIQGN